MTSASFSSVSSLMLNWEAMVEKSVIDNHSAGPAVKFMQAATLAVKNDGKISPAVRTLVFRGMETWNGSSLLTFATDLRSEKVNQVRRNSACEIAWYLSESWEQYRFEGEMIVVSGETGADPKLQRLRSDLWEKLSPRTRKTYLNPRGPGVPIVDGMDSEIADLCEDIDLDRPLKYFGLLLLVPTKVDYLNLKTNTRRLYSCTAGNWTFQDIQP